ncbi:MAG: gliding motility protein GldL [Bacteroidaceae bacterium]|nr:gliding motility protein GldL [Bacteroidaceae bacterium]
MATKYTGIQKWLRTKRGQTFLNYAYSWGASVVIAGALFKLTHTDGADIMLWLGMGTEVIVFFLAGFEPQESMDAQELAEEVAENAAIASQVNSSLSEETVAALANAATGMANAPIGGGTVVVGGGVPSGGTIVINGGGSSSASASSSSSSVSPASPSSGEPVDAAQLAENISSTPVFRSAQFQSMAPEMQEATKAYVEQLTELTDTLKKVAEQSARLTRDSEEMENMNRTLTGINRFYEMQLKSVGTQSATIDEVNEQTKKLAIQLQELNDVYFKMVEALKMKIA